MTIHNISPVRFHHNKSKLNGHFSELVRELTSTEVTVVGNYDLLETIGKGAYGKVKLGMHRLTGQKVAIKIVDKTHAHTVAREIEMWRHLHHPNITQLLEILTTETKIYMVMEHVTGGELFEHITNNGALNEPCGRSIFKKLLLAVEYIHKKRYVHRDLKLENILLDKNLDPKIIDFGFTRGIQSRRLLDTYCGSLAYVAPEVIAGGQYSGQESDVWSLGVILYTIMCGYLPFDDEDESVMQRLIVNADVSFPEGFPKECQDLISGVLKKNPMDRLTVEEILKHPWMADPETPMDYEMGAAAPSHTAFGDQSQPGMGMRASLKSPCQQEPASAASQSVSELRLFSLLTSAGMRVEMMKKSVQENLCDSLSALYYLLLKKNHEALDNDKHDTGAQKRRPTNNEMNFFRQPRSLPRASELLFNEFKGNDKKAPSGKRSNIQKLKTRAGIHDFKLPSPPFFKRFDLHFIRKHKPMYSSDDISNKLTVTITPPTSPNPLDKAKAQATTPLTLHKATAPPLPVAGVDDMQKQHTRLRNIRGLTVISNELHDERSQRSQVITNLQRSMDKPSFRAIQTTITEEEEDEM
ncbi:Pkinase-domain-containing protein [Basidiobolus meristosporus CBS 931.73]|uniref:Pkinase-domain-containing protein n=1 Tax=Basidiobolus meristosporus CBS 931.73 TaxID=1314790 RepID=A0A1Y1WZR7_9FUNG|nr:Pkinase-domain-containing protein [Basidiobolus meristosporus CBS 931.73]|eukprot:ORX78973.1 Pkinase-domain-containing protein [Basidiobolus meristosporus CBS 931.73]